MKYKVFMVRLKCWTVDVWKQTIWGAWKIMNLVGVALGLVSCGGKVWYERIHGQLNCYWELSWKRKCCCYCFYLDKSCHIFFTWLSIYYWWWHYTCRKKNTYKRINAICNIIKGIKTCIINLLSGGVTCISVWQKQLLTIADNCVSNYRVLKNFWSRQKI